MNSNNIKKLIDKINKRITRAEKAFDMDKETKEAWRGQLKDLVPDTDMLTSSGLLSMSQEAISMMDEMTLEVLEQNLPDTVKSLRDAATERIDDILQSTEDDDKASLVNAEVRNKIKVMAILDKDDAEQNISDLIKEMQRVVDNLDPMLELEDNVLYEEIKNISTQLYSKGTYSYSDMYYMIDDFQRVIDKYNVYISKRSN